MGAVRQTLIPSASRNPTSPSSASSCGQVAQDTANLAPKWQQNGAKMEPTWHQNGAKWSQNGSTFRKKSIKKSNATKKRADSHSLPPGFPQGPPFWAEKAANMAPSWAPKSIKNRSFFWCLLGSIHGRNLADFWSQNEAKLRPKWHRKSMWT